MFFDAGHFKDLGEAQARLAAKLANRAVAEAGVPIFGQAFEGEELDGFSTSKESMDTHVAFALGVETMGRLKPRAKAVRADYIHDSDLEQALKERNRQLEDLVRKNKEAGNE